MPRTRIRAMTIEDMAAVEPRIRALLTEAAIPTTASYWRRYSHYKALLSQHVGMGASRPALASCACYETMIQALCQALPEEESEAQV